MSAGWKRCAAPGIVERIDADHWKLPADIAERGMAHDSPRPAMDFRVRTLSTLDLERQIGSDGATWLDRELASPQPHASCQAGLWPRGQRRVGPAPAEPRDMGHAVRLEDGSIRAPKDFVADLERAEIDPRRPGDGGRARTDLHRRRTGDYVSGKLVGSTQLASGRFAMIDDGIGFQLVPWQPVLDQRIGQHITGVVRDAGGIEWGLAGSGGWGCDCHQCRYLLVDMGPDLRLIR